LLHQQCSGDRDVKRISPATVTFGVMAIVLGLVAAYIVRQSMEKPPIVKREAPPPPADPGVLVIIAARNLPANTRLSSEDLIGQLVPRDSKAAQMNSVNSIPYAAGRILREPMKAGQIVSEEKLLNVGEGLPELSERLPAGYRAVTIAAEGIEAGGEVLKEGDLVDISLTVEGSHPDLGEVSTRTLLRGVMVVDAMPQEQNLRGSSKRIVPTGGNLTVAVKPADANKLIVAQRSGTLAVTVVSAADAAAPAADEMDSITRRQLLGLKELPPPPKKFVAEKWSGGTMRTIEMSEDRVLESQNATLPGNPLPVEPVKSPATQPTSIENRTSYVPTGVVAPGAFAQAAAEAQ
jgi:pilus assembly protein CpaB